MDTLARKIQPNDFSEVAKIHIQAFPDQFASRIGEKYVSQMYRFYSEFPTGIVIVAVNSDNGEICGIRAGAGKYLLNDFRKKVALAFLPRILFKTLTDFVVLKTLTKSLFRKFGMIFFNRKPLKGIEFGIEKEETIFISQIIAVKKEYRGDLETVLSLIREGDRLAREMGYQKLRGQVYLNNPKALAFDRAIGFKELFRENGYCIIEKEI